MDKGEAFNQSRISFAILDSKLVFTMFDKRDHKDWLKEVYGVSKEDFENTIRGYMKDGNVYFYKSSKFKSIRVEELGIDALNHLQILSMVYMNVGNPTCFNGMHMGTEGVSWVPLESLGSIRELLSRRYRSSGITEYALATTF